MNARPMPLYPRAPFYFVLVLLIAFVAFWPSYFSRLAQTDLAHHFHGITATAWVLLLITQAWLMRQRKFALHRKLGRFSLVLAPLFVVSGVFIVHTMLASGSGFAQAFGTRLAFVDLLAVAWFAIAYGLAIHHRRHTPLHARYLASTAILVFPPALARVMPLIPAITSFEAAFHASFVITEAIVLALIAHDLRDGKARPPYILLLVVLLVQQAAFVFLPDFAWWSDFCDWFAAL